MTKMLGRVTVANSTKKLARPEAVTVVNSSTSIVFVCVEPISCLTAPLRSAAILLRHMARSTAWPAGSRGRRRRRAMIAPSASSPVSMGRLQLQLAAAPLLASSLSCSRLLLLLLLLLATPVAMVAAEAGTASSAAAMYEPRASARRDALASTAIVASPKRATCATRGTKPCSLG